MSVKILSRSFFAAKNPYTHTVHIASRAFSKKFERDKSASLKGVRITKILRYTWNISARFHIVSISDKEFSRLTGVGLRSGEQLEVNTFPAFEHLNIKLQIAKAPRAKKTPIGSRGKPDAHNK